MEYEIAEVKNFGLIRIMKTGEKDYPYALQFVTTKLNEKDLDWEDIQEYQMTKEELKKLFNKIKDLAGF